MNLIEAILKMGPFPILLLVIACSALYSRWWHKNSNKAKVSLLLAVITVIMEGKAGNWHEVLIEGVKKFVEFWVVMWTFGSVAGAVYDGSKARPTPRSNVLMVLKWSLFGIVLTPLGASFILTKTLLNANTQRRYRKHLFVFTICLTGNVVGMISVHSPPLLGLFQDGVAYFWFWAALWKYFVVSTVLLLIMLYAVDSWYYAKEQRESAVAEQAVESERGGEDKAHGLVGSVNLLILTAMGAVVALVNVDDPVLQWLDEALLIGLAGISWVLPSSREARSLNKFSWGGLHEIAILFFGIFLTMVPWLSWLNDHGKEFGLTTPAQYKAATAGFSSVLDNLPASKCFVKVAISTVQDPNEPKMQATDLAEKFPHLFIAICLGAVLGGSLTYIGNAPNFLILTIAKEEGGVDMPSFFVYTFRWALPIMAPVFAATYAILLLL